MIPDQTRRDGFTRDQVNMPGGRSLFGAGSGPTVQRIALGAQLRRLREARGLTTEKAASVIRAYEVQFIHGLMQTEDYARAVIVIGNADSTAEEIDRRVSLRMGRQQLLTQPDAPELWAVLDEATLRRSPDGPAVMRAQLAHLLDLTDLPNVTLQIVPFDAGPHAAAGGPFTILRFPEPDLPDVVYLEQLHSALYVDEPYEVAKYLTVMDLLCVQAATGSASKDMLSALLKQA